MAKGQQSEHKLRITSERQQKQQQSLKQQHTTTKIAILIMLLLLVARGDFGVLVHWRLAIGVALARVGSGAFTARPRRHDDHNQH